MRSSFAVIAAVAALLPATLAQNSVPDCVTDCLTASAPVASQCRTDTACLCKSEDFINASAQCYADNCSPEDVELAMSISAQACSAVGVTISTPAEASSILAEATGDASGDASDAQASLSATSSAAESVASVLSESGDESSAAPASSASMDDSSDDDSSAQRSVVAGLTALAGVAGLALAL